MPPLAEILRLGRIARGLTQSDAAAELHVQAGTVSRWERGYARPDPSVVVRVAHLYAIDAMVLLQLWLAEEEKEQEVPRRGRISQDKVSQATKELARAIEAATSQLRGDRGNAPPGNPGPVASHRRRS